MEGRINGCKGRGRPRRTFIREIIGPAGCSGYSHMKTLALEREEIYDEAKPLEKKKKMFL